LRMTLKANGDVANMTLSLGQSNGTFATTAFGSVAKNGEQTLGQSTLADINGDGILDSIFNRADVTTNGTLVYLGQSGGGFSSTAITSTSWYKNSEMYYGDINGDGRADLILNYTSTGNKFYVGLGQANGTFSGWKVSANDFGWGNDGEYSLADLNGDGRQELLFSRADGKLNVAQFSNDGLVGTTTTGLSNQQMSGTTGADNLTAGNNPSYLDGGAGNDTLTGSRWSDVLLGGAGNDTLKGGSGSDAYLLEVGSGSDSILDSAGKSDNLYLGADVGLENLVLDVVAGGDLLIGLDWGSTQALENLADRVSVEDYFTATDKPLENLVFADGSHIDLQLLVQAVSGFKDAARGQVRLSQPEALAAARNFYVSSGV
jgi:hypothetical protein